MLNIKVLSWSLGLFASVSFVLCVLFGLVTPQAIHTSGFLEAVLPGFRWLSVGGFLLGLIEAFLYGIYAGLVYGWIHNAVWRRLAHA